MRNYLFASLFLIGNYTLFGAEQQITIQKFHEDTLQWRSFIENTSKQQEKILLYSISPEIAKNALTYDKNNNVWYQFCSSSVDHYVNTVHYSFDGQELIMKGENDKKTSIKVRRLATDSSISPNIPFIPKFITFPFTMPYVAYDPIRSEITVAKGNQKVLFWRKHEANIEQMLLLRTIQMWMCLKKIDKKITTKESLFSAISQELDLNSSNMETIWKFLPGFLRSQFLNQLFNQIQKYGK